MPLGGVCLNVGCIPSKALLHVAAVMDEVRHLADLGVEFRSRWSTSTSCAAHKGKVVGKLTGGLAAMAKMRKVTTVRGYGAFAGPHHVGSRKPPATGQEKTGKSQVASVSQLHHRGRFQAVRLPFMPDDPRIVDSTGALRCARCPGAC
jgi:dihydrolipoamide dehydrogenase